MATERIPPQDLDAEQAVLGAMMVERELVDVVSAILTTADFYAPHHQTVYDVIIGLFFEGLPIDKVFVANALRARGMLDKVGGPDSLTRLLNAVPTTASTEFYAKLVAEKAKERRLIEAGRSIERVGWECPEGVDAAIERAEQLLYALHGRNMPTLVGMNDALRDWYADLEYKHKAPSIALPYPALHTHVGGLQPGWIYVLAGRPGHCKTMLALDIGQHVARTHPVMFGSLEEGRRPLIARAVSKAASIPTARLLTGKASDYDFGKAAGVMGELSELRMWWLDRPLYLRELGPALRRMKREHGLSLAVIDHSRKIKDMRRDARKNQTYVVEDVLDEIKDLAEELEIPILLLVHLGREAERQARPEDGPTATHVGDSDHYERNAAALIASWLPHRYNPERPKSQLMIRVLKSKYGPVGDIEFGVDLAYNRVWERSKDDVDAQLQMTGTGT